VESPKIQASVSNFDFAKWKDQKKSFRENLREWGFYITKQPRAALKDN